MYMCVLMYVCSVIKKSSYINWDYFNVVGAAVIAPSFHCICLSMYCVIVTSNMQSVIDYFLPVWPFKIENNAFNAFCCWLVSLIWYNNKRCKYYCLWAVAMNALHSWLLVKDSKIWVDTEMLKFMLKVLKLLYIAWLTHRLHFWVECEQVWFCLLSCTITTDIYHKWPINLISYFVMNSYIHWDFTFFSSWH